MIKITPAGPVTFKLEAELTGAELMIIRFALDSFQASKSSTIMGRTCARQLYRHLTDAMGEAKLDTFAK